MNGKDYYAILGVSKNATDKEIKQAYRRLARKHHPDVNPGDKGAEARFKEISEAYQTLGDREKRAQYDQFGHQGQFWQQAGQPGGFNYSYTTAGPGFDVEDLGSIFGSLFRDRNRTASPPHAGRKQDVSHPLELTLQEAYTGTTRTANLSLPETCASCRGEGAAPEGMQKCPACGGTGSPPRRGGLFAFSEACPQCEGRGRVILRPCPACRGAGEVLRSRRLEVKIPAGVAEGQKIRAAGQGPGGGDVFLITHIKPDRFFTRDGDDVRCEVPITIPEAVLGAEIEVPTLNSQVKVTVPPETSSGQTLRLSGLGFPRLKGSGRGDQYVKLRIAVPKRLRAEEKELIKKFAELRPEHPRRG